MITLPSANGGRIAGTQSSDEQREKRPQQQAGGRSPHSVGCLPRLDHRFSQNDSLFARYTGNGLTTASGTWNNLIGPVNQNKTDGTVLVLSETHLFSPTVVNEFRFGFSHARPYRLPTAPNTDLYAQLGLTGIPPITGMPTGLLRFNGELGIQSIGQRSGYYNDSGIVKDYNDNLSFIIGKHSLHAGASLRPIRFSHYESQAPRGDFQFFANNNAVDAQGNPVDVFLFDQNGRPIDDVGADGYDERSGDQLHSTLRADANGSPVPNLYPREQTRVHYDKYGRYSERRDPAPSMSTPAIESTTTTTSTTAPPSTSTSAPTSETTTP